MRKKMINSGFLLALTLPLGLAIACGEQKPTKIEIKEPELKPITVNQALVLSTTDASSLVNELDKYNDQVQNLIDENAKQYFLNIANVLKRVEIKQLDELSGIKALYQELANYLYHTGVLDLEITFAKQDDEAKEQIKQNFDLFAKAEIDKNWFKEVTLENVNQRSNAIKVNMLHSENFIWDQYNLIKDSQWISNYVNTFAEPSEILIYDFTNYTSSSRLDNYKISWGTTKTEAEKIIQDIGTNYPIL